VAEIIPTTIADLSAKLPGGDMTGIRPVVARTTKTGSKMNGAAVVHHMRECRRSRFSKKTKGNDTIRR